jgi:RHS repeat-associated protein
LTWTIDAWANMTAQTTTAGTCNSFSSSVNTKNQLQSGYQYDAAGNVTYDGVHHYTYDAESRIIQVDSGSTATYVYNENGQRVRKSTAPGAFTEFFYGPNGQVQSVYNGSGWPAEYVFAGSRLIADYTNGTTDFVLTDHLGSTRLMTGVNQAVLSNMDYMPYGQQIAGGSATTDKFTGQEYDSESGLYQFPFRYYESPMGRFMTPDPAGLAAADPSNPQSWNRYAYVLNNPLSNIDPDGLDCVYLNDAGDDVESIDHDSNAGECTGNGNGGYWVPGTVANSSWVTDIDQNNGTIGAYSNQDGFLGWTASANNDTGVAWQTVGLDVPGTNVVVNVTSSADDLTPEASTILSLTYLRSMHDLGCWFGVSSGAGQAGAAAFKLGQPVPGSKPFIIPGSSLGTSPLSEALHGTMSVNARIPTPVGGPGTGVPFRFANTSSLGTAAARYAPFAGLAAMGYSVYKLNSCLSSTPSGH